MKTTVALSLAALAIAPSLHADERPAKDPYYTYSKNSPWYDSYGRLRHGYRDAPLKEYAPGREPYYYYSDSTPWYDSYGRLRYGPRGTERPQGQ